MPTSKTLRALNTHWKMWWFYLLRLPSILWFGIRIRQVTADTASVSLPFSWRSQNPFQSIYFAAQCAAAELSTGVLALVAIEGKGKISMLITKLDIEFVKKATSLTTFTCTEGEKIRRAVQLAVETKEGQSVVIETVGTQQTGEVVAYARFTWSFKIKDY